MDSNIENQRKWLKDWVDAHTAAKLIERKGYYDSLAEDDDVDEPFEVWNEDMSVIRVNTEQATVDEITKLESLTQRKFPDALKSFWQQLGLFSGEVDNGKMTIRVSHVGEFLSCFSEESPPYKKLSDLGLFDMMNWVWGNDKSIFTLEPGQVIDNGDGTQTTREQLTSINNKFTCFGSIMDGYCESHIYLHYEQQNKDENQRGIFGATYWHQDNKVLLTQDLSGYDSPEELLIQCLKGYDALRAEGDAEEEVVEDEDPYFDMELLSEWLVKNS